MQRRNPSQQLARIRVVGIGGGGVTAVNGLIRAVIHGVDFLTIDADLVSLAISKAPNKIRIGDESGDQSGTSGRPERGKKLAMTYADVIADRLKGSEMVFILAGLGGGTGTGAAPVVAQIARKLGALVIGIVTYPFPFEDERRIAAARQGVAILKKNTDTLIVVPNDRLLKLADGNIGFHETYRLAHNLWHQSIQGIGDLVNQSGLINVDFADVRAIMSEGSGAIIATGRGMGLNRAQVAAEQATYSNLLNLTIDGAHGILFNVTGGPDMSLHEVRQAADIITSQAHLNANVIFGAAINHALADEIRITVIATGFAFNSQAPHLRSRLGLSRDKGQTKNSSRRRLIKRNQIRLSQ